MLRRVVGSVGRPYDSTLMEEGKVSSLDVVRAPGTATVSELRKDEAMVFAAGLQIPSVDLVVEVLRLNDVELAQLTPNSLVQLIVFEWALWSSGVEVSAKLFAYLHDARCQPKQRKGTVVLGNLVCV